MEDYEKVFAAVETLLSENDGFECYKFKVGTYNEAVLSSFKLPYDDDTFAILVLNTPKMFETSFKTWLQSKKLPGEMVLDVAERILHPIQDFMTEKLSAVPKTLPDYPLEIIHDFDLTPTRRPKILMCTCGHIAGAAYYVRPQQLFTAPEDIDILFPQKPEKPIIGVSLHHKYGGHFAFRAVYIFPTVKVPPTFKEMSPQHNLKTKSSMEEVLQLFNSHWRDGRFRDCGSPIERYSKIQLDYFALPPAERWEVIKEWFDNDT
uniref:Cyanocobalamin reductase (cyanide-eliminating) n=1 Tax=Panagrolaimus superbus TaxID=310955 RepID=A0A914Z786_9BILA